MAGASGVSLFKCGIGAGSAHEAAHGERVVALEPVRGKLLQGRNCL
ncbi:MAG TPA: hypothetical protein VF754_09280 [Pyrinomonadaceae bacterium]